MANTNAIQKMRQIADSKLPSKKAHLEALGKYEDEIYHSQVLVMTYVKPSRSKGGIILGGDDTLQEDRFQGKLALVIAMGPGAFKDDVVAKFHGKKPKVGDWVLTRPADGMEFFYNGCTVRLFQDVDIKGPVKDPTRYW